MIGIATQITNAEVKFLWERIKDNPGLLGLEDFKDFETFRETITSSDFVDLFPGCFAYYRDTVPGFAGSFHGVVYSAEGIRSIPSVKRSIKAWMSYNRLFRLGCEFPAQHGVEKYIQKLGFKKEGILRRAWWLPGLEEPLDLACYAIIKEDQEESNG